METADELFAQRDEVALYVEHAQQMLQVAEHNLADGFLRLGDQPGLLRHLLRGQRAAGDQRAIPQQALGCHRHLPSALCQTRTDRG